MFLDPQLVDEAAWARFHRAEKVIREAGELALGYFRNRSELLVETKADPQDVVSIADHKVEECIIAGLREAFPEDGFLGEEQGIDRGKNEYLWVIDPIDGTSCFLNGMPAWCLSVALMVGERIAFGLVFDPNARELFSALSGQGCLLNGKQVHTLSVDSVKDGLMGVGITHRVPASLCIDFICGLLEAGGMFVRNGSGALMLAYVAAGRLIGYFEPHINAWDCLAGLLLVREAGGVCNRFLDNNGLLDGNAIMVAAAGVQSQLQHLIPRTVNIDS